MVEASDAMVKAAKVTLVGYEKIGGGYVADAYVSTGSDGQVAPTCP